MWSAGRCRGDMQYLRIKQVLKDPCLPPEMALARQEIKYFYNRLDQKGVFGKETCETELFQHKPTRMKSGVFFLRGVGTLGDQ